MTVVNVGALLKYSRPQGVVLRCTGALRQVDRTPAAAITATSKVKLARKAQAGDWMEINGDECRQSSNVEALHTQSSTTIQVSPMLSDTVASLEPPPAFKMAQELTVTVLAYALQSTHDRPNPYVTILLTFLQTVLWHPEGLAMLKRVIPWLDLDAFLDHGHQVSSSHMQNNKLIKSSILSEDWAIRKMAWPSWLFECGFWDSGEGQLMEMEMLNVHDTPPKALDEDSMWEDNLDDSDAQPFGVNISTNIAEIHLYIGRDRCV